MKRTLFLTSLLLALSLSQAATFTVTDTTNGTTTDGVSLRWAITQANSFSTHDTIVFNIPGLAPHTIAVSPELPDIYDSYLLIDGTSQPANGYTGTDPKIIISNLDTADNGLYFFVPYTAKVKGIQISNFTEAGIYAFGSAVLITVEECVLSHNHDGVSIFGSVAHGDIHNSSMLENANAGVYVFGASAYALIENNLISGNGNSGIVINGGSDSCTIRGNRIGTDSSGTLPYPNALHGIYLANSDNVIGGALPGEGNIIAYNGGAGIYVSSGYYNLISRNSIFCNVGVGISNNFSPPVISNATTTSANGTAPANSRIELFYDSSCTNCQGKTFIDEVFADSTGAWTYTGTLLLNSSITATATDTLNSTSKFSACYVILTSSLTEMVNHTAVHLYPNPAQNYLNISFDKEIAAGEVNVFNSFGEKVYEGFSENKSSIQINTERFSSGIYFLQIIPPEGISLYRFTVVK